MILYYVIQKQNFYYIIQKQNFSYVIKTTKLARVEIHKTSMQIRKIFCNFKVLLRSSYSWKIGN